MRKLLPTLIISLLSQILPGQTNNKPENIYSKALEKFTAYLDSNYHIDESIFSFIHDESLTSQLPHQCFNHEILIQTTEEQLVLVKNNKKVNFFLISPMKFDGKEFVIGFSSYIYFDQMKSINAVWECHFRFDCESSKFYFLNVQGGGI